LEHPKNLPKTSPAITLAFFGFSCYLRSTAG
jgi:hypothetical protein